MRAATAPVPALRSAADRVRAGVAAGDWPYRHLAAAAGWADEPPGDDVELWLGAAGGLVAMREDGGLGSEADASLIGLEHADWLGAVAAA